jgi:hypothetical protein
MMRTHQIDRAVMPFALVENAHVRLRHGVSPSAAAAFSCRFSVNNSDIGRIGKPGAAQSCVVAKPIGLARGIATPNRVAYPFGRL